MDSFNNWFQTFLYELSSNLGLTDFFVNLRADYDFILYYFDDIAEFVKSIARTLTSGLLF